MSSSDRSPLAFSSLVQSRNESDVPTPELPGAWQEAWGSADPPTPAHPGPPCPLRKRQGDLQGCRQGRLGLGMGAQPAPPPHTSPAGRALGVRPGFAPRTVPRLQVTVMAQPFVGQVPKCPFPRLALWLDRLLRRTWENCQSRLLPGFSED